jgi:hypothetical protein
VNALAEQRSLTHKLIEICLRGMSLPFEQDKDGDFHLNLTKLDMTAWVCPKPPTELRILCIYRNALPAGQYQNALVFCSVFNRRKNMATPIFKKQVIIGPLFPMSYGGSLRKASPALTSSLRT